jgi:hypothetical protein
MIYNCRGDGSRVLQQMLMFLTVFAIVGFASELEHFHFSKFVCLLVAFGLSGLIAFPAFYTTRYAAEMIVALWKKLWSSR